MIFCFFVIAVSTLHVVISNFHLNVDADSIVLLLLTL